MVIRTKIATITLIALIAQPAFGMKVPTAFGKIATKNVAQYLSTRAPKLTAAPAKAASRVSNLGEFNPLVTQNVIKERSNSLKFTIKDALEICKGRYSSMANSFAQAAYATYSPSVLVEFMAKNNISATQMALEIAKKTKEFVEITAKNIVKINQELARDLKATGLGDQASEQIIKLKADAQASINAIQTIARNTITSLKEAYTMLVQNSKQTALNFASLNRSYFDKVMQQANENPQGTRGLLAATLLAGTAGRMGYEAKQQSDARRARQTGSVLDTEEISGIEATPIFEQTPVVDLEIEQAKRELAQADALWEANQAIQELEAATKKPFLDLKDGELAIGQIGFKASNIPGYTKVAELAGHAYTKVADIKPTELANNAYQRVSNYLSSWFSKN